MDINRELDKRLLVSDFLLYIWTRFQDIHLVSYTAAVQLNVGKGSPDYILVPMTQRGGRDGQLQWSVSMQSFGEFQMNGC